LASDVEPLAFSTREREHRIEPHREAILDERLDEAEGEVRARLAARALRLARTRREPFPGAGTARCVQAHGPCWYDENAVVRELIEQRLGNLVRCGGHENAVEGRLLGPARVTVACAHVNVRVAEPKEACARLVGKLLHDFDREHPGCPKELAGQGPSRSPPSSTAARARRMAAPTREDGPSGPRRLLGAVVGTVLIAPGCTVLGHAAATRFVPALRGFMHGHRISRPRMPRPSSTWRLGPRRAIDGIRCTFARSRHRAGRVHRRTGWSRPGGRDRERIARGRRPEAPATCPA
jgi:hypothetical protein